MASTLDPTEKSQPRKLFVERMRREGREQEWRDAVKAMMESTGKTWHVCSHLVMAQMGYQGPAHERKLYEEYQANIHKTAAEIEAQKTLAEKKALAMIREYANPIPTDINKDGPVAAKRLTGPRSGGGAQPGRRTYRRQTVCRSAKKIDEDAQSRAPVRSHLCEAPRPR